MRRAKIICTIGPASRSPDVLERLMRQGMDVARLNMSHGSQSDHRDVLTRLRRAARESGRALAVMLDLQGPRIRVGDLVSPVDLEPGQPIRLVGSFQESERPRAARPREMVVPVEYEALTRDLRPGARVLMDDGLIELRVEHVDAGGVRCRVVTGGRLTARKGVNFPGTPLSLPSITDKDRRDVQFGLEHDVEYLALSFVRGPQDVLALKSLVAERGRSVPVIAKIERPEAVEHLEEILACADGVMIARGDLAIEMSPEEVPVLQKRIIRAANRRRRLVITATQMLESMTRHPAPTRAEATDVANAVFDGTDAVMLSAETSIGRYPVDALAVMDRIVRRAESAEMTRVGDEPSVERSIPEAVCAAAATAATALRVKAIAVLSESGGTANLIASHRPAVPIVALAPSERVRCRLALSWGVFPLRMDPVADTDRRLQAAARRVKAEGFADSGDWLVMVTGGDAHNPAGTNLMKVHEVE